MDYELAKKLKDAGMVMFFNSGKTVKKYPNRPYRYKDNDGIKCPTLSELIEACGDQNITLVQCLDHWDIRWYEDDDEKEILNNDNPTVAFANLYLALHEKE